MREVIKYYDNELEKDEDKDYYLFKRVSTKDTLFLYYKSKQKKTLDELKEEKIKLSKDMLAEYLEKNPLKSDITGKSEEYSCTMEKQNQLVQTLMIYNLSLSQNVHYTPMWNTKGGVCEPWTIENLTILSFQMEQYVYPFIHYQQEKEVEILNATTEEELDKIEIDFSKAGENVETNIEE